MAVEISWIERLSTAIESARAEDKLVLLYFSRST